jgi:hypothetical protein
MLPFSRHSLCRDKHLQLLTRIDSMPNPLKDNDSLPLTMNRANNHNRRPAGDRTATLLTRQVVRVHSRHIHLPRMVLQHSDPRRQTQKDNTVMQCYLSWRARTMNSWLVLVAK